MANRCVVFLYEVPIIDNSFHCHWYNYALRCVFLVDEQKSTST